MNKFAVYKYTPRNSEFGGRFDFQYFLSDLDSPEEYAKMIYEDETKQSAKDCKPLDVTVKINGITYKRMFSAFNGSGTEIVLAEC